MLFDNPIIAINIDKDINNYEIEQDGLLKNGKLFIKFNDTMNNFLEQSIEDQTKLKEELMEQLKKYIK